MTDAMQPWPTLTEFLDAGGSLEVGWRHRFALVEFLYGDLFSLSPGGRARLAARQAELSRADEVTFKGTQMPWSDEDRRQCAWESELASDPRVVERVLGLLTPEEIEQGNQLRYENAHCHPLVVRVPNLGTKRCWQCASCGTAFDDDEAVVVTDREGVSDLPYEIEYCRECIAMALAAYDAGKVS